MRVLNWSSRVGCLQCSFNDKDLNEYVQLKKRRSVLQKKSAVQKIGRQFNNMDLGRRFLHYFTLTTQVKNLCPCFFTIQS